MKKDKRGRIAQKAPSERDMHILNAVKDGYPLAEIGRVYRISRQYVFQIKRRWPQFGLLKKPQLKNHLKK